MKTDSEDIRSDAFWAKLLMEPPLDTLDELQAIADEEGTDLIGAMVIKVECGFERGKWLA